MEKAACRVFAREFIMGSPAEAHKRAIMEFMFEISITRQVRGLENGEGGIE